MVKRKFISKKPAKARKYESVALYKAPTAKRKLVDKYGAVAMYKAPIVKSRKR